MIMKVEMSLVKKLIGVTNFAGVNGRPSGGSSMQRPGSEDPHQGQRNFYFELVSTLSFELGYLEQCHNHYVNF